MFVILKSSNTFPAEQLLNNKQTANIVYDCNLRKVGGGSKRMFGVAKADWEQLPSPAWRTPLGLVVLMILIIIYNNIFIIFFLF